MAKGDAIWYFPYLQRAQARHRGHDRAALIAPHRALTQALRQRRLPGLKG